VPGDGLAVRQVHPALQRLEARGVAVAVGAAGDDLAVQHQAEGRPPA
jgi:hypothetical protein